MTRRLYRGPLLHFSTDAPVAIVIALPTGIRVSLVAGVTDMRCGLQGLAAEVQAYKTCRAAQPDRETVPHRPMEKCRARACR